MHRRPDRLFLVKLAFGLTAGIIHQVHQTAFSAPPLQPQVKASVHLHQFAKMLLPLPPFTVGLPPTLTSPRHPLLFQPAPQRLGVHLQTIIFPQMLAGQRRSEIGVALPHPPDYILPQLPLLRSVRPPAATSVLQCLSATLPVPLPQPL